jgi:hypothetical protein
MVVRQSEGGTTVSREEFVTFVEVVSDFPSPVTEFYSPLGFQEHVDALQERFWDAISWINPDTTCISDLQSLLKLR